ncbi:MAG TPA: flagellar assembly protein FliW [Candidatus Binatia bacterium]|jgi:flagellar assembly factor FliW
MASTAEQQETPRADDGATVRVVSRRFGTLDVPVASILHFAQGLVGFPGHRRYVVLDHRPGSPFKWMLSLDEPDLAFAVANPGELVADYAPPLTLASRLLGATPEVLALFVLVTIPPDPTCMTVNLMAPVVVDMRTREARQIVLDDPRCPPDHRVVP